jgi:DNA mismatch endonuclease (patch repair protein)
MRQVRTRDTAIELQLRSELHRRGLRFRVDRAVAEGSRARPDVSFATERVAVYVDGCFWHRCPDHKSMPASNRAWWETKLHATVDRDRRHDSELEAAGWLVIRVWEHDVVADAVDMIESAVRSRR